MQELPNRQKPRAKRYDYTSTGVYFLTICTKDHEIYFWEIVDGQMILNEAGKICDEELHIMLQKRPSVDLHEYVIMPNHVHVLLQVGETNNNTCREEACPLPNIPLTQNLPNIPLTQNLPNIPLTQNLPSPPGEAIITHQTLWSIIWWRKSAVYMRCCKANIPFARQSSYYDYIIRDEQGYNNITQYIQNNPKKWAEDKMYINPFPSTSAWN